MKYKTHIAGGIGLGLLAINTIDKIPGVINANIIDESNLPIIIGGLVLGSLVPDIDHRGSYISRKFKLTSGVLSRMFKHRGFTHSILGAFTVTSVIAILLSSLTNISVEIIRLFSLSLLIGMFSHMFLDMLTPSGIELLNPIISKRFKLIVMPEFLTFLFLSYIAFMNLGHIV